PRAWRARHAAGRQAARDNGAKRGAPRRGAAPWQGLVAAHPGARALRLARLVSLARAASGLQRQPGAWHSRSQGREALAEGAVGRGGAAPARSASRSLAARAARPRDVRAPVLVRTAPRR